MDIEIKKADITYLKDIQNLNNELFKLEYDNFDSALRVGWTFEQEGTKYFTNMLNNEIVYIALNKNTVVGYLAGSINIQGSYVTKSLAEIDNMFVLEQYRKYGIGTKLINAFKQYCKENQIEELKVTASAKNYNAIKFYKKNGFDEFEITLKQKIQ
ncbi:MAG: GNAT family N-acetyltransferase [Clostridia bacterium]|nr:GNAT family N-acetyltransferase [Clostridia bacterium]